MALKRFKDFRMFEEEQLQSTIERGAGGLLGKRPAYKPFHKIAIHRGGDTGHGVLAFDYIQEGEIVEEALYIELGDDAVKVDPLNDYLFRIEDGKYALAFGAGSMFNHKNQPNVRFEIDTEKRVIRFTAIRNINPTEELFISYGKDYWKTRGIKPKELEK